jgi:FkbM family methyltransferase
MLLYRIHRIKEFFTSKVYRRVLLCRLFCSFLHRLNPNLRYLGMTDGDETTFLFLQDNVVTPYTVAVGNFARDELQRVMSLCKQVGAPLGGIFLDIGANIGTTTLYAMRSGQFQRALSVEPAPANLRLLQLNMHANGLEEKVKVRANALSDIRGVMQLALSKANCGDHRVINNPATSGENTIEIEVETLDGLLASEEILPESVSLVWVDTQGHEGYVLSGAAKLIKCGVPFCIEFWPQALHDAGCYESLLTIIEQEFESFVGLGPEDGELQSTALIRQFAKRFEGTIYHTDLFLVPRHRNQSYKQA